MSNYLACSILFVLAGCGDPASPPPSYPTTPAPAPTCSATADPLLEVDREKDAGDSVTSKARLLVSGAWTFEDSTGAQRSGCLAADDLAAISAALHDASWTVEAPPASHIGCMGLSPVMIDYYVAGKHVWQDRQCGTDNHLDARSRADLDRAVKLLEAAIAA